MNRMSGALLHGRTSKHMIGGKEYNFSPLFFWRAVQCGYEAINLWFDEMKSLWTEKISYIHLRGKHVHVCSCTCLIQIISVELLFLNMYIFHSNMFIFEFLSM